MGEFYCIPDSCATVIWYEYEAPKIRYRYPGEDWQEIEGDDYEIIDNAPRYLTELGGAYQVKGKAVVAMRTPPPEVKSIPARFLPGQIIDVYLIGEHIGAIYDWKLHPNGANMNSELTNIRTHSCNLFSCICEKYTSEKIVYARSHNGGNVRCKTIEGYGSYSEPIIAADSLHDIECIYVRHHTNCRNELTNTCTFKVYKNEKIVHQETRDVCPEIEKLDCHIKSQKEIKIKKFPYLSAIEISKIGYFTEYVNGVPYPLPSVYPIPDECLNIYRRELFDPLPESDPNTPNDLVFGDFITQICSAPGCPPPQYDVICDCNDSCESCPPDTCAVECGEHICCYNDLGVSVKQIDINNYCG